MFAAAGILLLPSLGIAAGKEHNLNIAKGKELAYDMVKGNCLACHAIEDGELPGNFGPPLIQMKARYPKKQALYDKIRDATKSNPKSIMPPFGKHGILTKDELNLVVDYIYSL